MAIAFSAVFFFSPAVCMSIAFDAGGGGVWGGGGSARTGVGSIARITPSPVATIMLGRDEPRTLPTVTCCKFPGSDLVALCCNAPDSYSGVKKCTVPSTSI
eukprot:08963_1